MDTQTELQQALASLSTADRERVREYVAFLRWRAQQALAGTEAAGPAERPWRFNFLEHFTEAEVRASRGAGGMEVKIAETAVGDESRPALWMHPPLAGEAMVEYHVAVPIGLRDLRLRFAIGVREGAQAADQLVAFRIRVDGWQVWSRAAWPATWQPFEIPLPFQAGNVLRLTFATDALGSHQFAWAVWGEPELAGIGA
jgi:hypothetical protein